jgi:hypothetical protein
MLYYSLLLRQTIEVFYETGPQFGELEQQQLHEIALLNIATAEQDRLFFYLC